MNKNQYQLLRTRRFMPLFLTRSFGAFNDNLYKNAIIFLATFGTGVVQGVDPNLLVPMAGGLFILPFFLFSATAGQLAEIYDTARLIRLIKLAAEVLNVKGVPPLGTGKTDYVGAETLAHQLSA